MPRIDISPQLVHFTSGADDDEAFAHLCSIAEQGRLIGGGAQIRGQYRCVCFTEAPLESLPRGLINPQAYARYKPFGVIVDKTWVYARGGRPVIYQSEAEYDRLPERLRWRHVRYEPNGDHPIDFTWEREWRLHVDELVLEAPHVTLVVPDPRWITRLRDAFDDREAWQVEAYADILGPDAAAALRNEFTWRVTHLQRDEVRAQGIVAS